MEIRRYWQIITRYWLLVAILTLVGLAAAYQYYVTNRPTYQAVTVVNITQFPSPNDAYSGIYANQSSEFAADEFLKVIPGNTFMTQVSSRLKETNLNIGAEELKGMVTLESKNRVLTISVGSNSPEKSVQVARTIATTLRDNAGDFVKPRQVTANVLDMPESAALSGGRTILLAAVRVIAGLIAGIGLAFFLAYLDNSIKTKAEAEETLGLPVLAAVPAFKLPPGASPVSSRGVPAGSAQGQTNPSREKINTR